MICQDIQFRINTDNIEIGFVKNDVPQCYIRREKSKHVSDIFTFTLQELEVFASLLPKLQIGLQQEDE